RPVTHSPGDIIMVDGSLHCIQANELSPNGEFIGIGMAPGLGVGTVGTETVPKTSLGFGGRLILAY
ncbi:hypothetical protein LLG39_00135, partial [bacterium]|nr:hypothetical protein [bacterium]